MSKLTLNDAINFINDKVDTSKLREVEEYFSLRLQEKEGVLDEECECLFYLLRSKLKKHSYFETLDCKNLRNTFIYKTRLLEKSTLAHYKKSPKGPVEIAQLEAFYKLMEHYFSALEEDYEVIHFHQPKQIVFEKKMTYRQHYFWYTRSIRQWLAYALYRLTSLYGNSMVRWFVTSIITIAAFGIIFFIDDRFSIVKLVDLGATGYWYDYFYYSITTFTTLGYGDIVPHTFLQKVFVSLEVMTGYTMLGMLIMLLGKKVK